MRILVAILLVLTLSSLAHAQSTSRQVRLATGTQGKTYHDIYGANLFRMLSDFDVRYHLTEGSAENLALISGGKVELAFVQADVYASQRQRDPDSLAEVTVLGLLADECLYIAFNTEKGPVKDFDDLKQGSPRVAVGPPAGGASHTWHYLGMLDPALQGAQTDSRGGAIALNHLEGGVVDAVVWVTDPANLQHPMLRGVHTNDDLGLMSVSDPKFEVSNANGPQIYSPETVTVKEGWLGSGLFARKIDTVCTRALLVARSDANPRLIKRVSEILNLQREQLIGGR